MANILSTIIFYPLFFLTLLVFELVFRVAGLAGKGSLQQVFNLMNRWIVLLLKLCGLRLEVNWAETIDPSKGYIFVSNHQSMFDIPILYSLLYPYSPVFVAKRELARGIPGVSYPLRRLGSCLINRSSPKSSIKMLREHGEKKEVSTIFFPEGTRSRTGHLKSYNKAGLKALLQQSEIETVNIVLDGPWRLTEKKFGPLPYGVKVRIKIDSPKRNPDLKQHLAEIEDWAAVELEKLRGQSSP